MNVEKLLVKKAKMLHGNISFCGKVKSWKESITKEGDTLYFWYNVGNNTKLLAYNLKTNKLKV